MSDVFREVDEEVRRDQWQRLWRAYGKYVFAVALLVVLGVAGSVGWKNYQIDQRHDASAAFAAAGRLVADGQPDIASQRFTALAGETSTGYAALAQLRAAEALAGMGDQNGAVAVLDRLAGDDSADEALRQLASLLAVYQLFDDADPADLERRLAPLLKTTSPWRASARELNGLVALRQGDTARAKDIFTALVEDTTAPSTARSRAAELLAALDRRSGGG